MPRGGFMPTDGKSGARIVLDSAINKAHNGKGFTANHQVSVGTATAVTVLLVAPAANRIHLMTPSVESDKAITWTISEAPNASGGTAITPINRDRANTGTSGSVITHTATYVSAGTVFETHMTNANGGPSFAPGFRQQEYVLATSQSYLIRAVAAAAATSVSVNLDFYLEE